MAVDLQEPPQPQNPPLQPHDDSVTHAFILEQMQRGFDAVNARIDRLTIVLIVGLFGIVASLVGVIIATILR